ncbi:uridine diphosphate glucose pyrophosphatase NUDT22 isoform X2 [Salarias fasciatus]|uniref:Nudix hydrolase domain-containing protein n=1 Tax=Salarias fasciatus TaxID=181472 RepID=A0A672GHI8_SALFA|nr:uridine diphosphate glucose pyrophosphatase isoform X2 [Salarias fasciatus]
MDPDISVLFHCAHWTGLLEAQVHVELSERFNRQTDPALERHIEEVWTKRVSKEPWLFNGAKFRLHSFCLASPKPLPSVLQGDGDQDPQRQENMCETNGCMNETEGAQNGESNLQPELKNSTSEQAALSGPLLILRLGLTCYRDYLGTNWSSQVAELRQRGRAEFDDPLALLAQPLGVGAVLCTDDGQVVFIRRSQRVAEAGGLLDIPGGHPEPKVVSERLGLELSEDQISVATMQPRPELVVSELFSSVCAEIRDEVNIPLSSLRAPVLLGIALNHTSAGRPSAEFYVSCSLTSDEVRSLYWEGGPEAHESTDIIFFSRKEVLQLDRRSPLWSEMCPSAKGAVLLYQSVKPDGKLEASQRESTHS